jgi:SAM-dependent methyltransferase
MKLIFTEKEGEYLPKEWESPTCPFCGDDQTTLSEKFGPDHRYSMLSCKKCELAYLKPRPKYDEEFVNTAYHDYVSDISNLWKDGQYTTYGKKIYNLHAELCQEFIAASESPGRKLLEIGCAFGWISHIARDVGWTVKGVDISPTMIKIAQKEFQVDSVCGDWTVAIPANEKYDFLYCSHVIEHIPHPRFWMEEFAKRMDDSSILWIEIPNNNCPTRKFKRFLKRIGLRRDRWALWRTPDHLYEPCLKSFQRFAESCGFEVKDSFTYSRKRRPNNFIDRLYHRKLKWGTNLTVVLKKTTINH